MFSIQEVKPSKTYPSLFAFTKYFTMIQLLLHVDNMLIIGTDSEVLTTFISQLQNAMNINDLSPILRKPRSN